MAEEIIYPVRINRYLGLKGLATRRHADELIEAGLVMIDGMLSTTANYRRSWGGNRKLFSRTGWKQPFVGISRTVPGGKVSSLEPTARFTRVTTETG